MSISLSEKEWVETAYNKGYTRLTLVEKMNRNGVKPEKSAELIAYFDELALKNEFETEKLRKERINEEKMFKSEYQEYLDAKMNGALGWKMKRKYKDCAKFEKSMNEILTKYKAFLKNMANLKKDLVKKFSVEDEKQNKELKIIRKELIERIIDSKEFLEVNHPHTGLSATLMNLEDLSFDELINLFNEGIDTLEEFILGRIQEEVKK